MVVLLLPFKTLLSYIPHQYNQVVGTMLDSLFKPLCCICVDAGVSMSFMDQYSHSIVF